MFPGTNFNQLSREAQNRILRAIEYDFKKIAKADGNRNLISKAELQEQLAAELKGDVKKSRITDLTEPMVTSGYLFTEQGDLNRDGSLDLKEFTAMFIDKYVDEYQEKALSGADSRDVRGVWADLFRNPLTELILGRNDSPHTLEPSTSPAAPDDSDRSGIEKIEQRKIPTESDETDIDELMERAKDFHYYRQNLIDSD